MSKIVLLGTTHRESGSCNERELARILEALEPEVVFEETRPSDFDLIYSKNPPHGLEPRALKNYATKKPVKQVPVDCYTIAPDFAESINRLFNYVESYSNEYLSANAKMHEMSWKYGFDFLNSQECLDLVEYQRSVFDQAVNASGDRNLIDLLSEWNQSLYHRENAMVDGIYDFCRNNSFKKGLFMIGTNHLPFIGRLIANQMKIEPTLIEWEVWYRS